MPAIIVTILFLLVIGFSPAAVADTKAQTLMNNYQQHEAASNAEVSSVKALIKSYFPDEGGSLIYGTAQVPMDRHNSLVFNKRIAEKGKTVQDKQQDEQETKVSDVKDFPVVLCSYLLRGQVEGVIRSYAKRYGFPMETYQKDWPGIREQAQELILEMVPAIQRLRPQQVIETDDVGEYQLKEVKRGSYCIFGYLITNEKAMYWLEDIESDGRAPQHFDFLRDNAIVLWEKNKVAPSAHATRMGPEARPSKSAQSPQSPQPPQPPQPPKRLVKPPDP